MCNALEGQRQSDNVEDRRGMSRGGMAIGGGLGGIVILYCVVAGADPRQLLEQSRGVDRLRAHNFATHQSAEDELKQFSATVLSSTEDVWDDISVNREQLPQADPGTLYRSVRSACGNAGAAVGPFLCPGDQSSISIYLSLTRVADAVSCSGDFAQAYVIAHEVGHHVQNLLGTMDKVDAARGRNERGASKRLSVRLELQADFLAGVWAHYAQRRASSKR